MAAVVRRFDSMRGSSARACSSVVGSSGARCRRDSSSSAPPASMRARSNARRTDASSAHSSRSSGPGEAADSRTAADAPLGCRGTMMGTPLTGVGRAALFAASRRSRSDRHSGSTKVNCTPIPWARCGSAGLNSRTQVTRPVPHSRGGPCASEISKRTTSPTGRGLRLAKKTPPLVTLGAKRSTNASTSG